MSEREATDVAAACSRLMKALARRSGNGELEALESLHNLEATLQKQLAVAVTGYRQGPAQASWRDIGAIMGITGQGAFKRWRT